MALPSIVLLIAFVGGVLVAGLSHMCLRTMPALRSGWNHGEVGAIASLAAYLHWLRFHVPITVAAGTLAAVFGMLARAQRLRAAQRRLGPAADGALRPRRFALALRWDMSDPQRKTRRADVAFWLHLAAAPLIVHPAFSMLGMSRSRTVRINRRGAQQAGAGFDGPALAVALYIVLASSPWRSTGAR